MVLAPRSGRRAPSDGEDTSLSPVRHVDSAGIVVLSPNLIRSNNTPNSGLHARSNLSPDTHPSGCSPGSTSTSSSSPASLTSAPGDEFGGRKKGKGSKHSESMGTLHGTDVRRGSVSRPAILTLSVFLLLLLALAYRSHSSRSEWRGLRSTSGGSSGNASPHQGASGIRDGHYHLGIDDGEDDEFNVHGIVEEGEGSVPKLVLPMWIRRPEQEGAPRVLLVSDSWLSCGADDGAAGRGGGYQGGGGGGGHARVRRQFAENRLWYARRRSRGSMDVWMSLDRLGLRNSTPAAAAAAVRKEFSSADAAATTDAAAAASVTVSTDPGWNGVVGISNLLKTHRDYDWLLYLAPDVLVIDLDFVIPWERYAGRDLVLWGSQEGLGGRSGGEWGDIASAVEPRVMLIRQSPWSISFVERLMEIGGIERGGGGGGEREAEDELKWTIRDQILEKIVRQQKTTKRRTAEAAAGGGGGGGGGGRGGGGGGGGGKEESDGKVSPRVALSYLLKFGDGVENVAGKLYFENSYHLSGCWQSVVPKLEQYRSSWVGDGVEPPFAVTFEDCDLLCVYGGPDRRLSSSSSSSSSSSFSATRSGCLEAFTKARAFVLNQTNSATGAVHRQRAPPASGSAARERLACMNPRVEQV